MAAELERALGGTAGQQPSADLPGHGTLAAAHFKHTTCPTGFHTGQESKKRAKEQLEHLSDTAAAALSTGGVLGPSL